MGGWVARSGSTGIDFSASAAAVPVAGWVLLLTIPAKANRNFVEVQNQSTSLIQIVKDDGAGTLTTTTSIFAAPAATAPGQGGGWTSDTFKGRVRVYGAIAGLEVGAYED